MMRCCVCYQMKHPGALSPISALLVAWFIFIFKNSILILSCIRDFIVAVSSKVIYWNFQYIRVYQNKKNKIILTIFKFIRFIGWYIHLKLIIYNIFTPFSNEHHSCRPQRFIKLWHTTPGWFQTVNLYYMVLLHFWCHKFIKGRDNYLL